MLCVAQQTPRLKVCVFGLGHRRLQFCVAALSRLDVSEGFAGTAGAGRGHKPADEFAIASHVDPLSRPMAMTTAKNLAAINCAHLVVPAIAVNCWVSQVRRLLVRP